MPTAEEAAAINAQYLAAKMSGTPIPIAYNYSIDQSTIAPPTLSTDIANTPKTQLYAESEAYAQYYGGNAYNIYNQRVDSIAPSQRFLDLQNAYSQQHNAIVGSSGTLYQNPTTGTRYDSRTGTSFQQYDPSGFTPSTGRALTYEQARLPTLTGLQLPDQPRSIYWVPESQLQKNYAYDVLTKQGYQPSVVQPMLDREFGADYVNPYRQQFEGFYQRSYDQAKIETSPQFFYMREGMENREVAGKMIYDPLGGSFNIYQTRPARPGFTPRYGFAVAGGGAGSLQSGGFSLAPTSPIVRNQWNDSYSPRASKDESLLKDLLANPSKYSRPGAEAYGGNVQLLDGRTLQPGTQMGRYSNPYNLANYVDPFGANLPKNQMATEQVPWQMDFLGASALQSVDKSGKLTAQPIVSFAAPEQKVPTAKESGLLSLVQPTSTKALSTPIAAAPGFSFTSVTPVTNIRGAPDQNTLNMLDDRKANLFGFELQHTVAQEEAWRTANKAKPIEGLVSLVGAGAGSAGNSLWGAGAAIADATTMGLLTNYIPKPTITEKSSNPLRQTLTSSETVMVSPGNPYLVDLEGWIEKNRGIVQTPKQVDYFNARVGEYNELIKDPKNLPQYETRNQYITEGTPDKVYQYGEYSKWTEGARRSVMGMLGFTPEQYTAYGEGLKTDKPGIRDDIDRVVYGAGGMMTSPGELAPAAIAGAAWLYGGGALGGTASRIFPSAGTTGTAANYAMRGVGYGIGLGMGAAYIGGLTDWGKASKEQTEMNIGSSLPILGAMMGGGGGFNWIGETRPVNIRTPSGGTAQGIRIGDQFFGGGRSPTGDPYLAMGNARSGFYRWGGEPRPQTPPPSPSGASRMLLELPEGRSGLPEARPAPAPDMSFGSAEPITRTYNNPQPRLLEGTDVTILPRSTDVAVQPVTVGKSTGTQGLIVSLDRPAAIGTGLPDTMGMREITPGTYLTHDGVGSFSSFPKNLQNNLMIPEGVTLEAHGFRNLGGSFIGSETLTRSGGFPEWFTSSNVARKAPGGQLGLRPGAMWGAEEGLVGFELPKATKQGALSTFLEVPEPVGVRNAVHDLYNPMVSPSVESSGFGSWIPQNARKYGSGLSRSIAQGIDFEVRGGAESVGLVAINKQTGHAVQATKMYGGERGMSQMEVPINTMRGELSKFFETHPKDQYSIVIVHGGHRGGTAISPADETTLPRAFGDMGDISGMLVTGRGNIFARTSKQPHAPMNNLLPQGHAEVEEVVRKSAETARWADDNVVVNHGDYSATTYGQKEMILRNMLVADRLGQNMEATRLSEIGHGGGLDDYVVNMGYAKEQATPSVLDLTQPLQVRNPLQKTISVKAGVRTGGKKGKSNLLDLSTKQTTLVKLTQSEPKLGRHFPQDSWGFLEENTPRQPTKLKLIPAPRRGATVNVGGKFQSMPSIKTAQTILATPVKGDAFIIEVLPSLSKLQSMQPERFTFSERINDEIRNAPTWQRGKDENTQRLAKTHAIRASDTYYSFASKGEEGYLAHTIGKTGLPEDIIGVAAVNTRLASLDYIGARGGVGSGLLDLTEARLRDIHGFNLMEVQAADIAIPWYVKNRFVRDTRPRDEGKIFIKNLHADSYARIDENVPQRPQPRKIGRETGEVILTKNILDEMARPVKGKPYEGIIKRPTTGMTVLKNPGEKYFNQPVGEYTAHPIKASTVYKTPIGFIEKVVGINRARMEYETGAYELQQNLADILVDEAKSTDFRSGGRYSQHAKDAKDMVVQGIREFGREPDVIAYVARNYGNQLGGAGSASVWGDEFQIHNVGTKQGVGGVLARTMLSDAKGMGLEYATLTPLADGTGAAESFWKHIGFEKLSDGTMALDFGKRGTTIRAKRQDVVDRVRSKMEAKYQRPLSPLERIMSSTHDQVLDLDTGRMVWKARELLRDDSMFIEEKVPVRPTQKKLATWDTTTTGIPHFDAIIKGSGTRVALAKAPVATLKMMSPDQFIEVQKTIMAARPIVQGEYVAYHPEVNAGESRFNRGVEQYKLDALRKEMQNPKAIFDSLIIERDATGKLKDFQEGRHRALVAKEFGVKEIPVWEFRDRAVIEENVPTRPAKKAGMDIQTFEKGTGITTKFTPYNLLEEVAPEKPRVKPAKDAFQKKMWAKEKPPEHVTVQLTKFSSQEPLPAGIVKKFPSDNTLRILAKSRGGQIWNTRGLTKEGFDVNRIWSQNSPARSLESKSSNIIVATTPSGKLIGAGEEYFFNNPAEGTHHTTILRNQESYVLGTDVVKQMVKFGERNALARSGGAPVTMKMSFPNRPVTDYYRHLLKGGGYERPSGLNFLIKDLTPENMLREGVPKRPVAPMQRLSDANRYADMERLFGKDVPLLETSKALMVPKMWHDIRGAQTALKFSPEGTVLKQIRVNKATGEFTGDRKMVGFKQGSLENAVEAWTTSKRSTLQVEDTIETLINPYSGQTWIVENKLTSRTPELIKGASHEHGSALFNLYDLPVTKPRIGANPVTINYGDVLGVNFLEGKEGASVSRVVNRPSQAVVSRRSGELGFEKLTREGETAIADFMQVDKPTQIKINKYPTSPRRKGEPSVRFDGEEMHFNVPEPAQVISLEIQTPKSKAANKFANIENKVDVGLDNLGERIAKATGMKENFRKTTPIETPRGGQSLVMDNAQIPMGDKISAGIQDMFGEIRKAKPLTREQRAIKKESEMITARNVHQENILRADEGREYHLGSPRKMTPAERKAHDAKVNKAAKEAKIFTEMTEKTNRAKEAEQLAMLGNRKTTVLPFKQPEPDYWRWQQAQWKVARSDALERERLAIMNRERNMLANIGVSGIGRPARRATPPAARTSMGRFAGTVVGLGTLIGVARGRRDDQSSTVLPYLGTRRTSDIKPHAVTDRSVDTRTGYDVISRRIVDQVPDTRRDTRLKPWTETVPDQRQQPWQDILPYTTPEPPQKVIPDITVVRPEIEVPPPETGIIYPWLPIIPPIPTLKGGWGSGGSQGGQSGKHGKYPWREVIPVRSEFAGFGMTTRRKRKRR